MRLLLLTAALVPFAPFSSAQPGPAADVRIVGLEADGTRPRAFEDPAKELPFQGVYRVRAGGEVELVTDELEAPNGSGFAPDGKTLYVSNALHRRPIWLAYDVLADGRVGPGRGFADARGFVREGEGVPDGLEVDAAGNLFAGGPGGVHVYAPDGTRLGLIVTGVKTGSVAFGEDERTLFVAADHWILRLRTNTRGQESARTE